MLDKIACITLCNLFTLTKDVNQNDISKRYLKTISKIVFRLSFWKIVFLIYFYDFYDFIIA